MNHDSRYSIFIPLDASYLPLTTASPTSQPWEHYIPVNEDFSDLLHRVEWCEQHLTDCVEIAERATAYIRCEHGTAAGSKRRQIANLDLDTLMSPHRRFANRTRMFQEGATRLRDYLDRINGVNM